MPRLTLLTQYFPPEMGAPQARLSELAERLLDLGWAVEVLTALPNYPEGKVREGYRPLVPVAETVGRLKTIRVPLLPSQQGFAKRVACYLSFAASASAVGPVMASRPDLLFVESPPLFIGFAAMALSTAWRCPYVFNVSDLWPESAIRMGVVKEGFATAAAERFELALYRKAAGVTGQSQEIIDSVRARSPGTATELITNGVAVARWGKDKVTPRAKELVGAEPGPIFMYAGLLGLAQGLDALLDLARDVPPGQPGRIVIVGDGPRREHLLRRIQEERLNRVKLLPAQPREVVPELLAAADVAVITLGMHIPGAVPSKIYEAMASELPILLVADGEPKRRVEDAGAGVVVSVGDSAALRSAYLRLASSPNERSRLGAGGRLAAQTLYDRDSIARRLDAFLRARL